MNQIVGLSNETVFLEYFLEKKDSIETISNWIWF